MQRLGMHFIKTKITQPRFSIPSILWNIHPALSLIKAMKIIENENFNG